MRRVSGLALALSLTLPLTALAQNDPPGGSIVETLGGDPGSLGDAPSTAEARATSEFYATLIDDEQDSQAELQMFLSMMPKGADLHHHYSGAIYVETYLEWAKEKDWKIDPVTLKLDRKGDVEGSLTIDEVYGDVALYRRVLSAWSTKDYETNETMPPDSAFFSSFSYFGPISTQAYDKGLKLLRDRAIDENVLYIETMLSGVRFWSKSSQVDALLWGTALEDLGPVLRDIADGYAASSKFKSAVSRYVRDIEKHHQGIDSDAFTMRYQAYASRDTNPSRVFGALTAAFAAADSSELVVGVNLVGAENGVAAIRDYALQMKMFQFLSQRYPNVSVALHAGELVKGMVPPEALRFHIRQAVEVGGAKRLGHCIDLPFETKPIQLMQLLKDRGVAVEINLTSNEFILGVEGNEHPFRMFLANKVPMVIATDDAGVSRNDLSDEYGLLASRYNVSYPELKQLVYNSITYAFLPEATKSTLKSKLDEQFKEFEQTIGEYAEARAGD